MTFSAARSGIHFGDEIDNLRLALTHLIHIWLSVADAP